MLEDLIKKYGGVEVSAMDVYTDMFHLGEGCIQKNGEPSGAFKANPVAYWKDNDKSKGHYRIMFEDTFEETLKELQEADFAIINGLTYFGRKNVQDHASKVYALIFDYDGVTESGLNNFLHGTQVKEYDIYPCPNYVILSGHGLHLYYLMEYPVPLYPNIKLQLKAFKYALIEKMWNPYTSKEEHKQFQGINQGFRVIGGKTKVDGVRVRAFRMNSHPHTLEELGRFIPPENRIDESKLWRETKLTLAEARKKYPEWYESKVLNKEPRKYWTCKPDLYEWWKRKIREGATYHHRYFDIMCLAIYAVKSGIAFEQLQRDAMDLIPYLNDIKADAPFTESDVRSALECYDERYHTFPIEDIAKISGIPIERNRRNGRKQELHLKGARAIQEINDPDGKWRAGNGRKSKQQLVREWQQCHPEGRKADCIRETGLTKPTVYKWWVDPAAVPESPTEAAKRLIGELGSFDREKYHCSTETDEQWQRMQLDNQLLQLIEAMPEEEKRKMGFSMHPITKSRRKGCMMYGKGLISWENVRPDRARWVSYWQQQGLDLPAEHIAYWER